MLYSVDCNFCVLIDNVAAYFCTLSLLTLLLPETCFWCAKAIKYQKLQTCKHVLELVFKWCLDINEGNWIHLTFFPRIDELGCVVYCTEVFLCVGQVLSWIFCALQCNRNVCNCFPKVIWQRQDQLCSFLVRLWPGAAQVCLFFDDIKFFWYFGSILVCSSKVQVLSSQKISIIVYI